MQQKRTLGMLKAAVLTLGLSASFGYSSADAATLYEIKKGDTVYSIAQQNQLSVKQLKQLNNLSSNLLITGQKLSIPTTVTIKSGDTLYSLAKKYNTTVSQLKHINHLASTTIIKGEKLIIPDIVYVKKGDTLFSIAKNYGLTVKELKALNGLKSNHILIGQKLKVAQSRNTLPTPGGYNAEDIKLSLSVKKGYIFDPEEPRKFILQYAKDGSYFTRIEVLDSGVDLKAVKQNTIDSLKDYTVKEYKTKDHYHSFYRDAAFYLHGTSAKTQMNIIVKKVDGKWLKFTIHYLNKEESEGITPQMIAMLETLNIK